MSFAGDGTTTIDLPGISAETAIATQVYASGANAGKTLLAGHGSVGGELDFFVARLLSNGSLDTAFGGGDGFVIIDFALNDTLSDVAIDASGRVVVAGTASTGSGANTRDFAVARITSTGVLDTTFSGDGKLTIDFGTTNDDGTSVALDGNTTYVGGFKDLGSTGQFLLAKITSAGALDTTYSGDGKVFFGFGGSNDSRCFDIAVDSASRVMMVGYDETIGGSTGRNFAYARVGTNALLDPDFSGDGLAATDFNAGSEDEAHAVAIDYAGRIVVGGFTDGTGGDDFAATRISDAGALDSSFNADGRFTLNLGGVEQADAVALHPDGTVTLGGMTSFGGFQAAMVQLTPTGNASTSFGDGGDGIQFIDFGAIDNGFALTLDPRDLRLVIAGTDGSGRLAVARVHDLRDPNFASSLRAVKSIDLPDGRIIALRSDDRILRLLPDGSVDPTFTTILPGVLDTGTVDFAVDSQGRVVVGGQNGNDTIVRRFNANGAPDTGFGTNASTTVSSSFFFIAITVDMLDRPVVVGPSGSFLANGTLVARLTTAGVLDTTFNGFGIATLRVSTAIAGFDTVGCVTTGADASVYVGGTASFGPYGDAFVYKLDDTGHRDLSYGNNVQFGVVQFNFGVNDTTYINDITLDAAGRVVVVGETLSALVNQSRSGFVARLTTGGLLDSTFSGDGKLKYQFNGGAEYETSREVKIDNAGTITIGGRVSEVAATDSPNRVILRRLSTTGISIPSFSGDGAWVAPVTTTNTGKVALAGNGAVRFDDGTTHQRLNVDPAIVDFSFIVDAPQPTLRIQFNDDVSATLSPNDLAIGSPPINPANYSVFSYDKLTNTALIRFNAGFQVPDGDYVVTFTQSGITNRQNMQLRGRATQSFYSLAGDANRDRTVNFDDLLIVSQNYGQAGRSFSQGNFNYSADGVVGFDDLLMLSQRFGTSLVTSGTAISTRRRYGPAVLE